MNKHKKLMKNRLLPSNMAAGGVTCKPRTVYSSGEGADINCGEMTFTNSSMTRQWQFRVRLASLTYFRHHSRRMRSVVYNS